MEKRSVSFDEDRVDALEERVEADEYDSVSEAVRERLRLADRLEERVDELETELQQAEARVREVENQLQHEREREDNVEELATFADVERRRARRRERLEDARRQAGLVEKIQWGLFGEPEDLEQRAADVFDEDRAPDRANAEREE